MAKKQKMKNIQLESKQEEKPSEKIKAIFAQESIYSEDKAAKEVYEQSRFGEIKENKVTYSLVEALYLLEKNKIEINEGSKKLTFDEYLVKARKVQPNFWVRYCVFRDLRSRGYIVKTALKFGADFRVYDRGIKPGEDHAKWIVYPVHESETLTWYDFSAKNRVAHSTRKRLLIGVIDEEEDVSYWEARWIRP
ncbi:tRNA-intron lyase [Candidatus Woesearchaeota archaeon]|nr:tRNA-intron lyase [Candidatus Woesearchaeota archaeon]